MLTLGVALSSVPTVVGELLLLALDPFVVPLSVNVHVPSVTPMLFKLLTPLLTASVLPMRGVPLGLLVHPLVSRSGIKSPHRVTNVLAWVLKPP